MRLKFLGTGSAATLASDNFQSNMLLTSNTGDHLLLDCGTDIRHSLSHAGLSPSEIDAIYISHLHADHVGGMEYMGFATKYAASSARPHLYLCDTLQNEIWERSLSGGMRYLDEGEASLETFFIPHSIPEGGSFHWNEAEFSLIQTDHIWHGDFQMPSYGLLISTSASTTFITTDTTFTPDKFQQEFSTADLIFHDTETSSFKTGVHAHYTELQQLDPAIRAKTWLYHYDGDELPDSVGDGFAGFVAPGQEFDLGD